MRLIDIMKKVLFIEDDNDTLEMLGYIAEMVGAKVVLQPNVLSVKEIAEIKPDLIFLDHWIGNQKGGDLCRKLKRSDATKHIPVILISALHNLKEVAEEACADGSLAKPFDLEDIQELIKRYTA